MLDNWGVPTWDETATVLQPPFLGGLLQLSCVLQSRQMTTLQHLFAGQPLGRVLQSNDAVRISQLPDNTSISSRRRFETWFEHKLERYRNTIDDILVTINNPTHLSRTEKTALLSRVEDTNMVIYQCRKPRAVHHDSILQLAEQVGLRRLDANLCANTAGLTELRVQPTALHQRYLPYSQRPMNWHTDGYYQSPTRRIRGMLLHCIDDADGGDSLLIDHEIVFGLLYQQNPSWIYALAHPEAMTVPANHDADGNCREEQTGPVYRLDSGQLHMRYTTRKKNILWRNDLLTLEAVRALKNILETKASLLVRHHLQPGEGILSNNVLHRREAFENSTSNRNRFLYRGRFLDPMTRSTSGLADALAK